MRAKELRRLRQTTRQAKKLLPRKSAPDISSINDQVNDLILQQELRRIACPKTPKSNIVGKVGPAYYHDPGPAFLLPEEIPSSFVNIVPAVNSFSDAYSSLQRNLIVPTKRSKKKIPRPYLSSSKFRTFVHSSSKKLPFELDPSQEHSAGSSIAL